jgi:hypothetical protein
MPSALAKAATEALGQFGDGARVVFRGAFVQQAGQHVGEGRVGGVIGDVTGVAHGQDHVDARHAVARHHPDLQAVGQGLLGDVRGRQRLVLAVGGHAGRPGRGSGFGGKGRGAERHRHGGNEHQFFHRALLISFRLGPAS